MHVGITFDPELYFVPELVTWAEAGEACASAGGQLVSIHSEVEKEVLLQVLLDEGAPTGSGVWIGATDLDDEVHVCSREAIRRAFIGDAVSIS